MPSNLFYSTRSDLATKGLTTALGNTFKRKPYIQSATYLGRSTILINGTEYPLQGANGSFSVGETLAVQNIGRPSAALYALSDSPGSVTRSGGATSTPAPGAPVTEHDAIKLQGTPIFSQTPTTGQPLLFNGAQWQPGGANLDLGTYKLTGNGGSTGIGIASDGSVGILATPTVGKPLFVQFTDTALSGTRTAVDFRVTSSPATDDTINLFGLAMQMIPLYSSTVNKGGFMSGIYVNPRITSSGAIAIRGIDINSANQGSGTPSAITSLYIRSITNTGGGAVTLLKGLNIDNQTAGVTNYSIYTGTGNARFGAPIVLSTASWIAPEADGTAAIRFRNASAVTVMGIDTTNSRVGIGVTTPSSRLHIAQLADTVNDGFRMQNLANSKAHYIWTDVGDVAHWDCGSTGNGVLSFNGGGTGRVGVGITTALAKLHISGGTTVYPSIKIENASTLVTTPAAGNLEYKDRWYLTDIDAARRHIVQAASSTVTATDPLVGDGYIDLVINGTSVRFVTSSTP